MWSASFLPIETKRVLAPLTKLDSHKDREKLWPRWVVPSLWWPLTTNLVSLTLHLNCDWLDESPATTRNHCLQISYLFLLFNQCLFFLLNLLFQINNLVNKIHNLALGYHSRSLMWKKANVLSLKISAKSTHTRNNQKIS